MCLSRLPSLCIVFKLQLNTILNTIYIRREYVHAHRVLGASHPTKCTIHPLHFNRPRNNKHTNTHTTKRFSHLKSRLQPFQLLLCLPRYVTRQTQTVMRHIPAHWNGDCRRACVLPSVNGPMSWVDPVGNSCAFTHTVCWTAGNRWPNWAGFLLSRTISVQT